MQGLCGAVSWTSVLHRKGLVCFGVAAVVPISMLWLMEVLVVSDSVVARDVSCGSRRFRRMSRWVVIHKFVQGRRRPADQRKLWMFSVGMFRGVEGPAAHPTPTRPTRCSYRTCKKSRTRSLESSRLATSARIGTRASTALPSVKHGIIHTCHGFRVQGSLTRRLQSNPSSRMAGTGLPAESIQFGLMRQTYS